MVGALTGGVASATHPGTTVLVDGTDGTPDGAGCGDLPNPCNTIQAGVDHAVGGDTVSVAAGSYAENVVLAKSLVLVGAQAGVDARGRAASESTISPASGKGVELKGGSAGATIDGFEFSGGARGIESTSGPIDGVSILNNRIGGTSGSAIFLNDKGSDITVAQNSVDGSSATGGGYVHLDQDAFDGFYLVDNEVLNATSGTGLFSDGTRNIGVSGTRAPLIDGNLFDGNLAGANLGRKAFEFGEITNNTFSNNAFPGLQGGIADSTISGNTFEDNGRGGLELTGFGGGGDPARGAQRNTITGNEFSGNGFAASSGAIFFSASQAPGTISTNVVNGNNISGNAAGATYTGTETIDVTCNWWGDAAGPSGDGPGGGDAAAGTGLDFEPWLTAPAPGGPCNGPLPVPQSKDDCKKGGWQSLTDDQGRPFRNQGDCVSYVSTGGRNKAAG